MSNELLITNAHILTPEGELAEGWLFIRGSIIAGLGAGQPPVLSGAETIDAEGMVLLPGFIDLHVHGAVGCEAMDADPGGLRKMAQFFAQHGVTSFLAATWTDSRERITAALEGIRAAMGPQPDGATLLGAYLEGPYLNADRCGAQSTKHIRRADRDEALPWLDMDVIRLVAVAPEFEENHWLIEAAVRRGVAVSAAHTAATFAQMELAVTLGLTHATHTYNAMTGLHHREPGTLGAVMTLPEIRAELIADNIHVHPAAMQVLHCVKGRDRLVLVTDAVRGAGMPDGEYQIDERTVAVRDGAVRLPDGTLAGSILTMDRALYNFAQATGEALEDVWQASSFNAARAIHAAGRKGSIEVGKDADLVLIDDRVEVQLTVAEGRIVYRP